MSLAHCFTRIAHLIGHPSRALMLDALLGAEALSAKALAESAGITAQTASKHLQLLLDARLVSVRQQGTFRYFSIADAKVHQLLQQLAEIRLNGPMSESGNLSSALRHFRRCHNHMAGKLGVALTQTWVAQQKIVPSDNGFTLTEQGSAWLCANGIDTTALAHHESCTDWTERVPHMAGSLGEALLDLFLAKDYARPSAIEPRALQLTEKGQDFLKREWGIEWA